MGNESSNSSSNSSSNDTFNPFSDGLPDSCFNTKLIDLGINSSIASNSFPSIRPAPESCAAESATWKSYNFRKENTEGYGVSPEEGVGWGQI